MNTDVNSIVEELRAGAYVKHADLIEQLQRDLDTMQKMIDFLEERERTNDTLLEQQGDKLAAIHDDLAAKDQRIAEAGKLIEQLAVSIEHCMADGDFDTDDAKISFAEGVAALSAAKQWKGEA